MTPRKITAKYLSIDAERMTEAGDMPSLEQLLDAVAQARERFAGKIRAARREDLVDDCCQ
jgi:hypothetical protein